MAQFDLGDICLYGCAACGILVVAAKDFNMETRCKTSQKCPQYVLSLDEQDDYEEWSDVKKESSNTLNIENKYLMLLHLNYVRMPL